MQSLFQGVQFFRRRGAVIKLGGAVFFDRGAVSYRCDGGRTVGQ